MADEATIEQLREALDELTNSAQAVVINDLGGMPDEPAKLERRNRLGRALNKARELLGEGD